MGQSLNRYASQEQWILGHLEHYGSITQLKAMLDYNCMRLASVIHRLRKQGYNIETVMESNKDGSSTYARYTLLENDNDD